jgi:hypothetical protein
LRRLVRQLERLAASKEVKDREPVAYTSDGEMVEHAQGVVKEAATLARETKDNGELRALLKRARALLREFKRQRGGVKKSMDVSRVPLCKNVGATDMETKVPVAVQQRKWGLRK